MAINYCTLNSTTVDTFCGNIRAKVLASLLLEKYGSTPVNPVPHVPSGSGGITGIPRPSIAQPYYRQPEKWVPPVISTELDRIRVTVNVQSENFHGQDEQAVRPDQSIVVVSNLKFEGTTIDVNITNINFN